MKQLIGIALAIMIGSLLVFLMFVFIAKLAAPYDIFGIKEISAEAHKQFYEENKERAKVDQQSALKEVLKDFNFAIRPVTKVGNVYENPTMAL